MLKRLLIGLIKGLAIGAAIGAGIQYGLPELGVTWHIPSGELAGYLLAMGAAGTTGVFAGKPPWKPGAWIEATLKGLVGVGIGALAYWAGATYGAFAVPLPGVASGTLWTSQPVLFLPAIASVYGAFVELDNTGPAENKPKGPKARVAVDLGDDGALDETVHAERTRAAKRRA